MITTTLTKISYGFECDVYDCGDGRCYKRYIDRQHEFNPDSTAEQLDDIYEAAQIAAEAGLGPDVYERDESGYYTEIVETFGICNDTRCESINCIECEDCPINLSNIAELGAALVDLFQTDVFDLHIGNVGRKNGKFVYIDFGIGVSRV